jgi:hypothetical protein
MIGLLTRKNRSSSIKSRRDAPHSVARCFSPLVQNAT